MNPVEFALAVLILIFGFTLIGRRVMPGRSMQSELDGVGEGRENERLRQQVQQLQERIRVLERIVTDGGVQTAAQIEALRDENRIPEKDKA